MINTELLNEFMDNKFYGKLDHSEEAQAFIAQGLKDVPEEFKKEVEVMNLILEKGDAAKLDILDRKDWKWKLALDFLKGVADYEENPTEQKKEKCHLQLEDIVVTGRYDFRIL